VDLKFDEIDTGFEVNLCSLPFQNNQKASPFLQKQTFWKKIECLHLHFIPFIQERNDTFFLKKIEMRYFNCQLGLKINLTKIYIFFAFENLFKE